MADSDWEFCFPRERRLCFLYTKKGSGNGFRILPRWLAWAVLPCFLPSFYRANKYRRSVLTRSELLPYAEPYSSNVLKKQVDQSDLFHNQHTAKRRCDAQEQGPFSIPRSLPDTNGWIRHPPRPADRTSVSVTPRSFSTRLGRPASLSSNTALGDVLSPETKSADGVLVRMWSARVAEKGVSRRGSISLAWHWCNPPRPVFSLLVSVATLPRYRSQWRLEMQEWRPNIDTARLGLHLSLPKWSEKESAPAGENPNENKHQVS